MWQRQNKDMRLIFRETDDQKVYASSDFHLNHDPKWTVPIWKVRGFNSALEMTDGIIESVNKTVRPNDILLFLGDFCLNTTLSQFEELLSRFYCNNIYMLHGNHPNPHYKNIYIPLVKNILGNNYTEDREVYPVQYRNIIYIGNYTEVIWNGQYMVLCHYAMSSWNEMKCGAWMLHGHEHSAVEEHLPEGRRGKILDVSWDYFKKPLSFVEIDKIMKLKNIIEVGHH